MAVKLRSKSSQILYITENINERCQTHMRYASEVVTTHKLQCIFPDVGYLFTYIIHFCLTLHIMQLYCVVTVYQCTLRVR